MVRHSPIVACRGYHSTCVREARQERGGEEGEEEKEEEGRREAEGGGGRRREAEGGRRERGRIRLGRRKRSRSSHIHNLLLCRMVHSTFLYFEARGHSY